MKRDEATKKLARILNDVDSHNFQVRITEVHVFGSYSRGAATPRDLDLIIVHDPLTPELEQSLQEYRVRKWGERTTGYYDHSPLNLVRTSISQVLRRPGEKLEIFWGTSREDALMQISHKVLPLLLWTPTDREWQTKLDSILLDPLADRHPREELVDPHRIRNSVSDLRDVTAALNNRLLTLERTPLDEATTQLNPLYAETLSRWSAARAFGKANLKVVPYALAWMQRLPGQARAKPEVGLYSQITSWDGRYAAYLGRPALRFVFKVLPTPGEPLRRPLLKVCLILTPKKDLPNELLIFAPGENKDPKILERILSGRPAIDPPDTF